MSPANSLLGRKLRSRLDLIYTEIGRKVSQSQSTQKLAHDWRTNVDTWSCETVNRCNFVCSVTSVRWTTLEKTLRPLDTAVQLFDQEVPVDPIPAPQAAEQPELQMEEAPM